MRKPPVQPGCRMHRSSSMATSSLRRTRVILRLSRRRSLRLYVASDGLGAIHGEQVGQVRRLIIALNSAMEVLFVPLVVFLNWNTEPRRRWIIVIAAVIYVVHRAWTYLIYAERRLATGTSPLS